MATITPLRRCAPDATLTQAWVEAAEDGAILLAGLDAPARTAAGCLLQPEPGDRVLAVVQPGQPAYVLCVLEKAGAAGTLDLGGGARITARDGALALEGRELELRAGTGRARFDAFSWQSRSLTAQVGSLRALGLTLESVFDRVVQRARTSLRWIRDLDHAAAGRVRRQVQGQYSVQSGSASITAEGQVKVDGRQIHLG
jgi:hypothetical protein